jgi:hypothetical protein
LKLQSGHCTVLVIYNDVHLTISLSPSQNFEPMLHDNQSVPVPLQVPVDKV